MLPGGGCPYPRNARLQADGRPLEGLLQDPPPVACEVSSAVPAVGTYPGVIDNIINNNTFIIIIIIIIRML